MVVKYGNARRGPEMTRALMEFLGERARFFRLDLVQTAGEGWQIVLRLDGDYTDRDSPLGTLMLFQEQTGLPLGRDFPEWKGFIEDD